MCAAWRCGGLVFRLRCRMVFPPAAFCGLSGACSRRGVFRPYFRLFARCVVFCRCWQMLPRLVLFWLFAVRYFCRNHGRILRRQTAAVAKGCFSGLSKRPSFGSQKVVFCSPKGYLLHAERPPFRKWLFGASGIASRQPSGQGRAVPRQGHPEGIIRGVRQSEILLLFIVRNIKFRLKVNLCPDFVSYYLSVGSNVFA